MPTLLSLRSDMVLAMASAPFMMVDYKKHPLEKCARLSNNSVLFIYTSFKKKKRKRKHYIYIAHLTS